MGDRNITIFGPDAAGGLARRREIEIAGHIVDARVSAAPGLPRPLGAKDFVPIRGLIDTGSSDVGIDVAVAREAGLKYMYSTTVGGVGGRNDADVYLGLLEIPEVGYSRLIQLYASRLRSPSHDALIGRSVLCEYHVTFHGPQGTFTFVPAGEAYLEPVADE